jgi:hypothetical protein
VVVGAARDDERGEIAGAAYVYVRDPNSWSQQAKILSTDTIAYDEFGIAVALSGDNLLVGARSDDDGGSQSGSVYAFRRTDSSWAQVQKLIASDDAAKDLFGSAVARDGDFAIVGAPGDDSKRGSAYLFEYSGTSWAQVAKLTAGDGVADDLFGTAVAIAGDIAAVSAPADDSDTGAVYIYERDGANWTESGKITLGRRIGWRRVWNRHRAARRALVDRHAGRQQRARCGIPA